MAVRNNLLGGIDWKIGDKWTAEDRNDTFDEIAKIVNEGNS